jgi:hypothetical protein
MERKERFFFDSLEGLHRGLIVSSRPLFVIATPAAIQIPIVKIRYKLDTHENRDEASCEKKRELQGGNRNGNIRKDVKSSQIFDANAIAKQVFHMTRKEKEPSRLPCRPAPSHGIISEVSSSFSRLLRGTLHPLSTRGNVVIVLIHSRGGTVGAGLRALAGIGLLQLEVLDHGVGRGLVLLHAGRKHLFEELEVLQLTLLGELDVELDVKVAVVVVAERGHTLAGDNLDGI